MGNVKAIWRVEKRVQRNGHDFYLFRREPEHICGRVAVPVSMIRGEVPWAWSRAF